MPDAAPHFPSFRNLLWCRSASTGLPTVAPSKVERAHAFEPVRKLEHLGIAKRAHGVVIAALPVLLHGAAGEFDNLGDAFVLLGEIDQLHDVTDTVVGHWPKPPHLVTAEELVERAFRQ